MLYSHSVSLSREESGAAVLSCPAEISMKRNTCFIGGTIKIDGVEVSRLGQYQISLPNDEDDLIVELRNSRSYGRLSISGEVITIIADLVLPPKGWNIEDRVILELNCLLLLSHRFLGLKT